MIPSIHGMYADIRVKMNVQGEYSHIDETPTKRYVQDTLGPLYRYNGDPLAQVWEQTIVLLGEQSGKSSNLIN